MFRIQFTEYRPTTHSHNNLPHVRACEWVPGSCEVQAQAEMKFLRVEYIIKECVLCEV
jgi:hypothetical protein